MIRMIPALALAVALPCGAQDAKSWLESQGLEAVDTKTVADLEVVVARLKGAKDSKTGEDRVVVIAKGKPVWQSNPKETDPGSRWTLHSVGKDLDGDGQPDMHFSSHSGGAQCCTTHHVLKLKPQIKRLAAYSAGSVGGGEFLEVEGRKAPVMISADDSSANAFAPYANSYFPVVILEVGPKGRLQFARDLMQSRLPGQPPPVCTTKTAAANPWLKERCGEYTGLRRTDRTKQIKARLDTIKSGRSAANLKSSWPIRVLPIPGSPSHSTIRVRLSSASSRESRSTLNSWSRPTNEPRISAPSASARPNSRAACGGPFDRTRR